jgi:hypothetical protein
MDTVLMSVWILGERARVLRSLESVLINLVFTRDPSPARYKYSRIFQDLFRSLPGLPRVRFKHLRSVTHNPINREMSQHGPG